ncbi:MAG TPA: cytochrome C oxidase subunit I, partial [Burkholderiaceae bacterium]|nr:cytochrome C oxidase subunit I [Burkholderiaceae bacterium]
MKAAEFSLAVPTDGRAALARGWLWLGLVALLASGVFALLLVLARTPGFQHVVPWEGFFHTALVVHVDLSVLVWFIAFGGVMWSLGAGTRWLGLAWVGAGVAAFGTGMIVLAPFVDVGNPLINNYVPVLQQPFFLIALALFGIGALLLVVRTLVAAFPARHRDGGAATLHFGIVAAALTAAIAALALAWSYATLPESIAGRAYYELLFWGGGHVLQFTYTLLMLVAWLWLASAADVSVALPARVVLFLLVLGFVPVLLVPIAYLAFPVSAAEHVLFFTLHMQYAGGIAAAPLALVLLYGLA